MPESLQYLIDAPLKDDIVLSFTVLIAAVFVFFTFLALINHRSAFVRSAPILLTSLGILGTFFGVFVGLQDFNILDTNNSFPKLLKGLQIAFSTSIFGLGASILFRLFTEGLLSALLHKKEDDLPTSPEEILAELHNAVRQGNEQIAEELRKVTKALVAEEEGSLSGLLKSLRLDMRDAFKEQNRIVGEGGERISSEIQAVAKALTSDEESSLAGLLKSLRLDIQDGFKAQKKAFEEFAEQVAKANAEQLLKALEEVIREFNEKLAEQIGDSFKELAGAVEQLITWQENYRDQMEEMKKSLEMAITGIAAGKESLEKIAEALATMPESAGALREIVTTVQAQLEDLDRHLRAFGEVRDKATEAFPIIEKNLENLSTGLKQAADGQVEAFNTIIESQQRSAEQIRKGFDDLKGTTESAIDRIQSAVEQSSGTLSDIAKGLGEETVHLREQVAEAVSTGLSDMNSALQTSLKGYEEQQEKLMSTVEASLKGSLDDYRNAQREHLSEVQESLGGIVTGVATSLEGGVRQMDESLKVSLSEYRDAQRDHLEKIQTSFENVMSGVTGSLESAVHQMDRALKDQVERIMQEMVDYLSGITERQVGDFQPLIEALRRTVEEARAGHGDQK